MAPRVDFSSAAFHRDPAAGIAALRARGPVVATWFPIVGKVWVTTTYDATAEVLKDTTNFTMRKQGGALAGLRWWMPKFVTTLANNMLTMERAGPYPPARHRRRGVPPPRGARYGAAHPRHRRPACRRAVCGRQPVDLVQRYARTLRSP